MAPKRIAPPPARRGRQNRVELNHRPRVDVATAKQLAVWQRDGVSLSVLIDRLTAHALRTNFRPGTDCL